MDSFIYNYTTVHTSTTVYQDSAVYTVLTVADDDSTVGDYDADAVDDAILDFCRCCYSLIPFVLLFWSTVNEDF